MQLHYRYELGFIPPAIDGKRHELRVELTKAATGKHKGVRLRYRPECSLGDSCAKLRCFLFSMPENERSMERPYTDSQPS